MSNLTVDGTSTWKNGTGPDTASPLSNGSTGDFEVAEQVNGVVRAALDMQTVIGNPLTLKGTAADLASRLAVLLAANGSLQSGSVFPVSPPPVDGQLFYRNDLKTVYIYDLATGQWVFAFVNNLYALLDGTLNFTGPITIKSVTPGMRLIGQEASALDWTIRESGGLLRTLLNTGTEAVPVLTEDNFFCPTGIFMPYGAATAPNGWLLCDGAAISRATYIRLFNIIGTSYGSGDGSTTFNVPDLRGRVPIGVDVATGRITSASVNGANAATLGGAGGLQTHTLTAAQIPSLTLRTIIAAGGATASVQANANASTFAETTLVNLVGGGNPHSNTQPWVTVNYIIKT